MKLYLICALCLLLGGCQFIGTLFTGVRKIGTMIVDDRATEDDINDTKIYAALKKSYVDIDPKLGLDVEPTVFEGRVLLAGALPNVGLIQQVLQATWRNPGVIHVYNYIRITEPSSLENVNQDAALSAKIRAELSFTKGIASTNYKIAMENGAVYIMGIAKNKAELDLVTAVIKNTVGVQKVVSLVRFE